MNTYKLTAFFLIIFLVFYPWRPLRADQARREHVLASHVMSLEDRHPAPAANEVYKDNILLALSYMKGESKYGEPVNWEAIRRPGTFKWTLPEGKTFAFHDGILPQYIDRIEGTTNAHFDGTEGFKSDGYLMGNGVCHLASFMDWVAKDAHLGVNAPTNHDFAVIPDISKEYGVAIYSVDGSPEFGGQQNLYITNNTGHTVIFTFTYDGRSLTLAASEE